MTAFQASAACTEVLLSLSSTSGVAASTCRDSTLQLCLRRPPSLSKVTWVPHVRQSYNWDCGLACVMMVLRAAGIHAEDLASLHRQCGTISIWTIDLAHLLRKFHIDLHFLTLMLGPNPAYAAEGFYMEHMQQDARRVRCLFKDAANAGIRLQHRSVSAADLGAFLLAARNVIIALVDKGRLDRPFVDLGPMNCSAPEWPPQHLGYTGHYIVLYGYDGRSGDFCVHDPALGPELLSVSTATLDAARKSFGTDEDLLLISLPSAGYFQGIGHFAFVRERVIAALDIV